MTEALKPCPFCLGPARVYGNDLGNNEWIARCRNIYTCGARGSAWLSEAEAIAAWNHRAALAQPPAPPAPTAPPCNRDRNSYCQCERKAMMCDGVGPAPTAQPVQQPGAEPDGRLHADGYFTWKRRDGYVLDAKLPCDFYLAAPAQRQPMSEAQIWEIGNTTLGQQGGWNVTFARAIEAAHGITAATAAQKGEKL